jgi:hypothetical protein
VRRSHVSAFRPNYAKLYDEGRVKLHIGRRHVDKIF